MKVLWKFYVSITVELRRFYGSVMECYAALSAPLARRADAAEFILVLFQCYVRVMEVLRKCCVSVMGVLCFLVSSTRSSRRY
jgi:hypothetical protein